MSCSANKMFSRDRLRSRGEVRSAPFGAEFFGRKVFRVDHDLRRRRDAVLEFADVGDVDDGVVSGAAPIRFAELSVRALGRHRLRKVGAGDDGEVVVDAVTAGFLTRGFVKVALPAPAAAVVGEDDDRVFGEGQ